MDNIQSNNKRIAKNTIILYIRMFILMVTSLYTSRIVLASLGVSDFGIYNVVGGIVAILGFLNGTLSTASSRYITVSLGRDDLPYQKKVFSSVLLINILLCILIVLLCETVGLWFLCNKMVIPDNRLYAAHVVYQLSILTIILNIISVPYNACIIAHEKMKVFAYISLFDAIAKLAIAFLISLDIGTDKLILYAILLFVIQLIDRIIYGQYCARKFAETSFKIQYDRKLLKEMGNFISWSAYGSLVSVGFTQGLNVLLNIFFGPSINAARGIAVQVQNAVHSFIVNFQTAINPQLTKSVAKLDLEKSVSLFCVSSKFSFFLICLIAVPIIGNIDYILTIWLKQVPDNAGIFVQLMLCISLFQTIANPMRIVNQAEGNIKKFQICECSLLAMILPLSYIALKIGYSAESVFIVQLVIEIIAQFVRAKIVLPKIQMSFRDYFVRVYARIIIVFIPTLSFCLLLCFYLPANFYSFFFNTLCTIFMLCIMVYFLGVTKVEKKSIKKIIKTKIRIK